MFRAFKALVFSACLLVIVLAMWLANAATPGGHGAPGSDAQSVKFTNDF